MAHFAELNNVGLVTRVIVVSNSDIQDSDGVEQEALGITFCQNLLGSDTTWKQTSYNANFRKNFAGIGYLYDSTRNAFIAPQPFVSWKLNETTCQWEAPVTMPDDGNRYVWNEATKAWDSV